MVDYKKHINDAEELMQATVEYLDEALAHIRAGKANTRILDGVKLEYYGSLVPLTNVATVTTPDAKTIAIQPYIPTCQDKREKKSALKARVSAFPTEIFSISRIA